MPDYRYLLSEREIPKIWYNVIPDLPAPMSPPLHPGTLQPAGPQDLEAIFPHALIEQEVTAAQNIPIPEPVLDILRLWRPTPLHRAIRLEKALGTPARIFFKNEGVSPAGSHKPNTAIAQAYYNKAAGVKRLTTETGAGQWGSALSLACNVFGMECMVYMVKCSFYQKPHRRTMMECWGAKCVFPSPSDLTQAGGRFWRKTRKPRAAWASPSAKRWKTPPPHQDTNYSLGSVLNHVLLHQTVIGQEAIAQMKLAGATPDIVIGCCGGGSNFAGLAFPFVPHKGRGQEHPPDRRGARRVPHHDQGHLRLRLRR